MTNNDRLLTTAWTGRIGIAREDITPPVGISVRSWGAATHEVAEGIHLPLALTVIALISAEQGPLLWVGVDFGTWRNPADELYVREAIMEACKVDESRVIVALSHTHAGPNVFREDIGRPGTELIAPYLRRVRDSAARAAAAACDDAKLARLSWRYGRCDLAKNRDRPSGETDRLLVGFNPDIPADDTLLVGRIEEQASGRVFGVIVNYACHPTTLAWQNRLISPDYPGATRELVERETGGLCLFLQGASGDLAPAEQYVGDPKVAERHGRRLGHAVLATLAQWPEANLRPSGVMDSGAPLALMAEESPLETGAIAARCERVDLALKPLPSLAELEEAWRNSVPGAAKERLWRQKALRRRLGEGSVFRERLWIWRIGEAFVVAQPNELYSVAQQDLRRRFAPRPIAVLNLCNGSSSYLPTKPMYRNNQYAANITPFVSGSLERVIERAADSILEILQ